MSNQQQNEVFYAWRANDVGWLNTELDQLGNVGHKIKFTFMAGGQKIPPPQEGPSAGQGEKGEELEPKPEKKETVEKEENSEVARLEKWVIGVTGELLRKLEKFDKNTAENVLRISELEKKLKTNDKPTEENPEIRMIKKWADERLMPFAKNVNTQVDEIWNKFRRVDKKELKIEEKIERCDKNIEELRICIEHLKNRETKDPLSSIGKVHEDMKKKIHGTSMEDVFFTIDEAAKYAGVERKTIYRWTLRGLPFRDAKITNKKRFIYCLRKSDLDQWLANRKRK